MVTDTELVDRITEARRQLDARRAARARVEARMEAFGADLDKMKETLREEGIDPSKLDTLIAEANADLERSLTALEEALGESQVP